MISHYICYLLSNVLLFNAVISLDYELPNDLHKMRLVDCIFLKPNNYISHIIWLVLLLLRPKSTAMVIAGRSVHLTTLFPGQA